METGEAGTHSEAKNWIIAGVVFVAILALLSVITVAFTQHSKDSNIAARAAHDASAVRFLDAFTSGAPGSQLAAESILNAPGDRLRVCVSPDGSRYVLWAEFPSTDSPYVYHSTVDLTTNTIAYDEAYYGYIPYCVSKPEDKKETEIVLFYPNR